MCLPKFKSFKIELLIQIAPINQYIDYLYFVMRYRYHLMRNIDYLLHFIMDEDHFKIPKKQRRKPCARILIIFYK